MIPPGDYVLAFGDGTPHPLNPDDPFPDTFYPSAPDFASATVVHLAPGQQILNADIHLPQGRQTRTLEVVLKWNGMRVADTWGAYVTATATGSLEPYARKMADGTYTVNLLPDATYRIRATASCKQPGVTAATTDTIVVDGSDESMARVTLTFAQGACQPK
jgi:hypothetical protein